MRPWYSFLFSEKSSHPKHQSDRLKREHRTGWAVLMLLLTISTAAVKDNALNLRVSVLDVPEHAPFDGTVYPIQQVPDWLSATTEERNGYFSDFPEDKLVTIPTYDADRLRIDSDDLVWGDEYDDYTRETQITYSVPYAGTYKLDGVEGAGSHPGIDIKALRGTPVYSIMNGVVERVTHSSSGFGNLVVVRHENVPDPDNPQGRTTLYSGYAHLDTTTVKEGDVVVKGQQVGTVGDTGTATTWHLHFQVDNNEAPWHLYWPFTTAEANKVGGFWEAINIGLNRDNVYAYTINPFDYIHDYMDADGDYIDYVADEPVVDTSDDDDTVEVVEDTEEDDDPVESIEVSDIVETPSVNSVPDDDSAAPFVGIQVDYDQYLTIKETSTATVSLRDSKGELVRQPQFNSPIKVKASDPSVVEVFPGEIDKGKFLTGETEINLFAAKPGSTTITFSFLGDEYASIEVFVSSTLTTVDHFEFEAENGLFLNSTQEIAVVAVNSDGHRVLDVELDEPLDLSVIKGEGVFSRSTLTEEDFENGIATVLFTPTSGEQIMLGLDDAGDESKSELFKLALFSDVNSNHVYYQAISSLKENGVIQGYDDGTFRPDQPVSRVEALKFIFAGLDEDLDENAKLTFSDTENSAWYAPYVASAQKSGIVSGYPDGSFKPANEVIRVEFMKMLIETMGVDVDPVVIGNPYLDVHYLDWYAPYAQFVKDTNIEPWGDGELYPSDAMTRGEVAEMIYRVLVLQENDVDEYSRTLSL
jgi:hypothetical protein